MNVASVKWKPKTYWVHTLGVRKAKTRFKNFKVVFMREFLFFQAEYFLVFRKDFLIFLLLADAEDHVMKTFESTNTVNV